MERDELVAEEIKQLIDEADAKRVARVIFEDFEDLLSSGSGQNGHSNGSGNGHTAVSGTGSASSPESPVGGSSAPFQSFNSETTNAQLPLPDEGFNRLGGE